MTKTAGPPPRRVRTYTAQALKKAQARAEKARARAIKLDAAASAVAVAASARIDKARAAIDNANARTNKAWSKYIDAQLAVQAAKVADDNAKGTP